MTTTRLLSLTGGQLAIPEGVTIGEYRRARRRRSRPLVGLLRRLA